MKSVGVGQILMAVLILAGVIWFMSPSSGDPTPTAQASSTAAVASVPAKPAGFDDSDHWIKNQEVPDAVCRKSLACWSDKHQSMAEVLCKASVESQTQYQVKWTDGMFHPFFSGVKWGEMPGNVGHDVVYVGDQLEVQNQFGACENMTYACPYNPDVDKSVTAILYPGKLPPA